jgi:protocatechuate 3,4-dioxygenase beta subunit
MSLIKKNKQMVLLAVLLILFAAILTEGCGTSGSRECEGAQFGSTITVNPSTKTWNTGGTGLALPITDDWKVTVLYPDGSPMPYACLNISGALAVPGAYAIYQFQAGPSWTTPAPVNSGFRARTDTNGQYTFSTVISAPSGTWKDTIYVESGANKGSADYEVQ